MDYRNPKFTASGAINCEIEHPNHGWIPFTASPDDVEQHGRDIYNRIIAGGGIEPYAPPAVNPEQVKAEAYRRIVAVCPEWKQRNLTAQASILAEKGRENWTPEDLAAWEAGEAIWKSISAIRAASNEIEGMEPIPQDFADDKYWPK